ncbi:MAG: hypothetical protein JOY62_15555 [Acidobacteriaceae bacterium]|nr:hypothetical protein [Acidobacteriaceae bacterium]MBV9781380.1 hypothetical protein [Acidobacteriaceae bacterium]
MTRTSWRAARLFLGGLLLHHALAQQSREPGKVIGTVSKAGDLIVMTLKKDALGKANLFNLTGRTLKFRRDKTGYLVENVPIDWNPNVGDALKDDELNLRNFIFPFSGKNWNSFSVGSNGSIRFGPQPAGTSRDTTARAGAPGGGISIGRFDPLQQAAPRLINTIPSICVFFKPRVSGTRYAKELADRVVITWNVTEPAGNIQDFTWTPTVNRFQAVLRRDGSIDMSYQELSAKDAIVGIYPQLASDVEQQLVTLAGEEHPELPSYLDLKKVQVAVKDGVLLKITFQTRGPGLKEGDPAIEGIAYRLLFGPGIPKGITDEDATPVVWTIRGVGAFPDEPGGAKSRFVAWGPGLSRRVDINGNSISMTGVLPEKLKGMKRVTIHAEATTSDDGSLVSKTASRTLSLNALRSPEVHLSSIKQSDGPYPLVYEAFHYLALPNPRDLACTVIKSLGDKFDFLAYYSDFRVDNQEAGTPSDGPKGGNVTGIGETERDLGAYCSAGRFQWGFVQPVYVGSNQMQAQPPEELTDSNPRNIATYKRQLGERSLDGKMLPYNYAISQIAHEMGHRWSAFVSAKVSGEIIPLGPTHWARGLQAPVAFPYQRPTEASAMGGGVWQDNFDGTYTQLDDDYYVPATGWSYLDLYLMGLISPAEVPDFFILRNLERLGEDANHHPIFKAERTKIRIEDVITVEGPRTPDVFHSQRNFNTGMVLIIENGTKPSRELIDRANGIRERWINYWATTTGGRASMTVKPD